MANEWIGIVHENAPKYLKGVADLTVRRQLILSMLESRGRVVRNAEMSYDYFWDVQKSEAPVEAYGDGGQVIYNRRDLLAQAHIDSRGYIVTDLMTEKEMLLNKGDVAIVNRYERIMPTLSRALRNKFGLELYIDGYATGNENRICGFESFCGCPEAQGSYTDTTCDVADLVAKPADTYAGLSTALGTEGTWSTNFTTNALGRPSAQIATDWPEGSGSAEYDYWSPKLVNTASTSWGSASPSNTWLLNCELVLMRTLQWLAHTNGQDGPPNICLVDGKMHTDLKTALIADRWIPAPHKEAEDLGFAGTINYEGLIVHSEYGVPANTGYMLNVNELELLCLYSDLFASKGPTWDPKAYAYLFSVGFFGNMRYTSPKYFAKLYPYAAS